MFVFILLKSQSTLVGEVWTFVSSLIVTTHDHWSQINTCFNVKFILEHDGSIRILYAHIVLNDIIL